MTIQIFNTVTGLELIGQVVGDTDSSLQVKAPIRISIISREGELSLAPYSITNHDGTHTFYKSAILSTSDRVPLELEKEYTRMTSGIII